MHVDAHSEVMVLSVLISMLVLGNTGSYAAESGQVLTCFSHSSTALPNCDEIALGMLLTSE